MFPSNFTSSQDKAQEDSKDDKTGCLGGSVG